MACLDHHMYNNDPRLSFSNDFVESSSSAQQPAAPKPVLELTRINDGSSSDFEFSVSGYSMMSADELFFKGRLMPFKDTWHHPSKSPGTATTTLRDELLAGEDDYYEDGTALRPPKVGSAGGRLRGLFGLRKAHIGSKNVVEAKINVLAPAPQAEPLDETGSSCGNMEM